jgi:hypothetical protein
MACRPSTSSFCLKILFIGYVFGVCSGFVAIRKDLSMLPQFG